MLANFSFGMMEPSTNHPLLANHQIFISTVAWSIVLLNALAILNILRALSKNKFLQAFVSSALMMAAIILFFALGLFPNLMVSTLSPDFSLDIYNSSSSDYTLKTMFVLALIGMPFVIAYTTIIYWSYRGVTKLDEQSY
jgi:cytochrome bd ubiquinol oxidase subunit II